VRRTRVWAQLLGVKGVIVEEVATEEDEDGELAAIVVAVRVPRRETNRCGVFRRRGPGYDRGKGGDAGGHWTWERCQPFWRRRRRECADSSTASSSPLGRGRATARGTRARSRTPPPGW
jgi:hypothetical protein